MHPATILQLITLLAVANGAPVIARRILGERFALPLDGGFSFLDGRPLLGPSKTLRGVLLSVLATSIAALALGLELWVGVVVGSVAMFGDALSSFLKRRLGLPPSSMATGLDQIPESLLPVLACWTALSLTLADVAVVVLVFLVGEIFLSRVFYRLHLRDRPY